MFRLGGLVNSVSGMLFDVCKAIGYHMKMGNDDGGILENNPAIIAINLFDEILTTNCRMYGDLLCMPWV